MREEKQIPTTLSNHAEIIILKGTDTTCTREHCGGRIMNMGYNYGCMLCAREAKVNPKDVYPGRTTFHFGFAIPDGKITTDTVERVREQYDFVKEFEAISRENAAGVYDIEEYEDV